MRGSFVYGTNQKNSDYDFIGVSQEIYDNKHFSTITDSNKEISVDIYSQSEFTKLIQEHKIFALECLFLDKQFIIKNDIPQHWQKDSPTLRSSISSAASLAFVKAKKKFEIEKDRNIYIGKKSLFHSLRIIDFGIQIAKCNKINDYGSCNSYYRDIMDNPSESWNDYHFVYHSIYNSKMTEFRKVCPKN